MFKLALTAGFFGVLAGCATISPGDYVVYQLAFFDSEASASCFGPDGEDVNTSLDEGTLLGSSNFALFRVEDNFYLDIGEFTLSGTKTDDVYKFRAETVDVDFNFDETTRYDDTEEVVFSFTVNGKGLVGTRDFTNSGVCTGPECDLSDTYDCTSTAQFIGSEIKDVELQFPIPGGF